MAKVKKDWAREKAEHFVDNDGEIHGFRETESGEIVRAELDNRKIKRLAALLRRTFEKGYQIGVNMGDTLKR
jgi:hypothetical protein